MSNAKTPVLNLVLEGDADAQGHRILNLDLSGLATGAPFFDDTALIRAAGDPTKLARFSISDNTTGTLRVFTLPDYNGRVATLAGTEDLTNKTLNGLTFGGSGGGILLNDAVVSLTGGLLTEGDVSILSQGELIVRAPVACDVTLPASGTLATFAQLPIIANDAYDAVNWNNNMDGATKNAIRDKFESLVVGIYAPPFDDDKPLLRNNLDATKTLEISLAGLTTATERTLTVQNKNGTIACLDDIPDFAGIAFAADQPDRLLYLAGDVQFFGGFALVGGFGTTLNVTAGTELTLPVEGTLATLAGEETFTNKIIVGGSVKSINGLSVRSTSSAFDRYIQTADVMTLDRTLTLALGDANRTLTLANNFTTAGNFALTLTQTGTTNLILPTNGTLTARVSVPFAADSTGIVGRISHDSDYLYVCVATDTWKRTPLSTW